MKAFEKMWFIRDYMHNQKTQAAELESRHFISFTIDLLTHLTWHAACRQRMGLGGPTQTGGWHQLEGREGRETQKHREREWWQSDVETTQNRKWWGQVFSKHDGKLTNTGSNIRLFFFFSSSLVCCLQNAQQSCMWNSYYQQVEVNLCFILLTKTF